ncbi:transposable element Tc1 transposase [Trichonephila clavipes]|nr:transposable element Tc1 transposase [Trichonephila clavipes]
MERQFKEQKQRKDKIRVHVKSLSNQNRQDECGTIQMNVHLWDHDGGIRVRRYVGERCFLECVIERHSGLAPEVMFGVRFRIMDNPICYELRLISKAIAQNIQLLPWPAYSSDMSPIEHVGDLVGRRLARDPRPTVGSFPNLARGYYFMALKSS